MHAPLLLLCTTLIFIGSLSPRSSTCSSASLQAATIIILFEQLDCILVLYEFHHHFTLLSALKATASDQTDFDVFSTLLYPPLTEVLLGVVEDLAFATMFETGKLTPLNLKPIHIASMLSEVLEAAYATDERGNIKDLLRLSIRCSNKVPPVVCADSSLQRILFNLVSNAMQFCSEKGEVSLAVHFSQPKPATNGMPQPLSGTHTHIYTHTQTRKHAHTAILIIHANAPTAHYFLSSARIFLTTLPHPVLPYPLISHALQVIKYPYCIIDTTHRRTEKGTGKTPRLQRRIESHRKRASQKMRPSPLSQM